MFLGHVCKVICKTPSIKQPRKSTGHPETIAVFPKGAGSLGIVQGTYCACAALCFAWKQHATRVALVDRRHAHYAVRRLGMGHIDMERPVLRSHRGFIKPPAATWSCPICEGAYQIAGEEGGPMRSYLQLHAGGRMRLSNILLLSRLTCIPFFLDKYA